MLSCDNVCYCVIWSKVLLKTLAENKIKIPYTISSITFGINRIQRHMVVQNMMRAEGRTKVKVVCSDGSTCASGTPNTQTMTTL